MPVPKYSGPDPTLVPRLIGAAGLAGLLALNGYGLAGAIWFAVVAGASISVNLAAKAVAALESPTAWQRLGSAVSVAIETTIWAAPAVLFWRSGSESLRLAAAGLLYLQVFFAAAFAYREVVSLVICGGPPALILMVLVAMEKGQPGPARLTGIAVALGGLAFAVGVAKANGAMLRSLEARNGPEVEVP